MEENDKLSPELKDIIEMIHRYSAVNKECCFVFGFLSLKPNNDQNSQAPFELIPDASRFGAYGYLPELREVTNGLRDLIEDNADENGAVNV